MWTPGWAREERSPPKSGRHPDWPTGLSPSFPVSYDAKGPCSALRRHEERSKCFAGKKNRAVSDGCSRDVTGSCERPLPTVPGSRMPKPGCHGALRDCYHLKPTTRKPRPVTPRHPHLIAFFIQGNVT